jgi:putative nucleotidyltransferase-like protein
MRLRRVPPLDKTELAFLDMLGSAASGDAAAPASPWEDVDWTRISGLAKAHDLKNMIYASGRDSDWLSRMPDELRDDFKLAYVQTAITNTRFLSELVKISRDLNRSGIQPVLLKGGALAAFAMPDIGTRPFADLDILVAAHELDETCRVMKARGYVLDEVPQSASFYREHHFHYIFRDPTRPWCCIEIHWDISIPEMGVEIPIEHWRERSRPRHLDGAVIRVFEPVDFLIHLCLHSAMNNFSRLSQIHDLHYLLNNQAADIDPVAFWTAARYSRISKPAAACLLLSRIFGPNETRERLLTCRQLAPDMTMIAHLVTVENVLRRRMSTVLSLGSAIAAYRRDTWRDRLHYRLDRILPSPVRLGFSSDEDKRNRRNPRRTVSMNGLAVIMRAEIYNWLAKHHWEVARDNQV